MFMRSISLALLLANLGVAAHNVSQAYATNDGKAHIVYVNGTSRTFPAESKQVKCEGFEVASDRRTVGWSVLVDNCCTSYPIATSVAVVRDNRKILISTGQMIWQWQFVESGKQVAVLSGPVHGSASDSFLYDSRTGKLIASWNGKGTAPAWAKQWADQFVH